MEPRPTSALSVRGGTQTLAVQEASLFEVPKEHEALLYSPELKKMEKFAMGTKYFLQRYEHATQFMGPQADTKVKALQGLDAPPVECADAFKTTIRGLGEKLFLNATETGRDFCLTFCEFQKLCQGQYYHALDALFSCSDEPIPIQEFAQILPINDITKAVDNLSKKATSSVWLSDLFLGNIYAMQSLTGDLKSLCDHFERLQGQLAEQEDKILMINMKRNEWQAKLQQSVADEAAMQEVRTSEKGVEDYYKKQLELLEKNKAQAEKQEHDYTYRMFGPFKYMWENDVRLAKEKVDRYTREILETRQKLSEVTDRNNTALLESCAKKAKEAGVEANLKMQALEGQAEKVQNNVAKVQKEIDETVSKIAYLTKKNGGNTVDHLLDSMDAMKSAGKSSSAMAGGGRVVVAGWIRDLNFIAVLLNRMSRAKDLQGQKKAFNALKAYTSKPENLLCQLLQHAEPVVSLMDASDPCTEQLPAKYRKPLILYSDTEPPPQDWLETMKMPDLDAVTDDIGPVDQAQIEEQAASMLENDQPVVEAFATQLDDTDASNGPPRGACDTAFVDELADLFED